MDHINFGKYLRDLRKSKSLTLEGLGRQAGGLSKSYLSNIENGRHGIPSPEILRRVAEPLGISYEELMIKAGYWDERFSPEDKQLFEEIHNDRSESISQISEVLKILADDDGFFPDYMHDDIFKIFGGHFVLSDGNRPAYNFDEFYEYDYLKRPEPEDYYGESELIEIRERFNRVYNYTTIKNALSSYRGEIEFLDELITLADKHGISIGEKKTNFTDIDLSEVLSNESFIIRFNNKLISQKSRHKLMGYARALADVESIMEGDS